jgi:transposase
MHQSLRPFSLVPSGFVVVSAVHDAAKTTITVRASKESSAFPSCGTASRRVHSRYYRRVGDLPLSGRSVELVVIARRFRCEAVLCGQQIFVERFASNVLAPSARRTGRLDCIVHHLGLALGGRPAASLARRLMLPVSNDTLLRVVHRRAHVPTEPLSVIGIDDWAWRRNHRYGTIICDLERRRPVTLLPDREPATTTAWLETVTVTAIETGVPGLVEGEESLNGEPRPLTNTKGDVSLSRWSRRSARSSSLRSEAHKQLLPYVLLWTRTKIKSHMAFLLAKPTPHNATMTTTASQCSTKWGPSPSRNATPLTAHAIVSISDANQATTEVGPPILKTKLADYHAP